MAQKTKNIEARLATAEATGQQALREAVLSTKMLASGAAIFRVADWLEKSKRGERYLPSPWRITRQLYASTPVGTVSLVRELEWASVVLGRFSKHLTSYIAFKQTLQLAVLKSRWTVALDAIGKGAVNPY